MAVNETALTQAQIDRGEAPAAQSRGTNVNEIERWASAIGGGALAIYGLTRGTMGGVTLALLGGALLYRGATGHCELYDAIGFSTAGRTSENPNVSVQGGHGIKVEKSLPINRPAKSCIASGATSRTCRASCRTFKKCASPIRRTRTGS